MKNQSRAKIWRGTGSSPLSPPFVHIWELNLMIGFRGAISLTCAVFLQGCFSVSNRDTYFVHRIQQTKKAERAL